MTMMMMMLMMMMMVIVMTTMTLMGDALTYSRRAVNSGSSTSALCRRRLKGSTLPRGHLSTRRRCRRCTDRDRWTDLARRCRNILRRLACVLVLALVFSFQRTFAFA